MAFLTRFLLTLIGMAFALLFTLGVLCWLALYVTFASVRWLVTGQKPQVVMMWQQIKAFHKGMQPGQSARWSGGAPSSEGQRREEQGHAQRPNAKSHVIEDVVVREIPDKRERPKD